MRRALTIVVLMLSVAAIGAAQENTYTANARLTNGELASLILEAGQPQATPLQPAVALQQVQKLGFMPAHWRSSGVVTQQTFSQTVARFGLDYRAEFPQTAVTRGAAENFLASKNDQVQENLAQHTDAAVPPHSVFNEARYPVTSAADFK